MSCYINIGLAGSRLIWTAVTEIYLRVDSSEKLEIVEAVMPPGLRRGRFTASDTLIASLFDPG